MNQQDRNDYGAALAAPGRPVRGVRTFYVKDFTLVGLWDWEWKPGEQIGYCRLDRTDDPVVGPNIHTEVPGENCTCGFYAYWPSAEGYSRLADIWGVVQGYGTTLIGELGFRSEKALLLGLSPIEGITTPGLEHRMPAVAERYGVPWFKGYDELLEAFPTTETGPTT